MKKLFSFMFCLLLFIGIVTLSASAASGTVKSVTLNGLDDPVPGEPMDFSAEPLFSDLYGIMQECIFWYDEDDNGKMYMYGDSGTSFKEGHVYRVRIYVESAADSEFPEDPSTMTAFIGDYEANVYKDLNGYFVQLYYDPCGTINNIDVFIDYPVAGEAPSFNKVVNYRYYSDGNVSPEVNGVSWYDETEGKYLIKGTGMKFLSHHTYKVSFTLKTSNCEFGNATAKVNRKTAVLEWYNPYMVGVEYTFDALDECLPTIVSKKDATCTENGNIEYYACNCGEWYSDAAGTQKITDKNSVVIPAKGHTNKTETTKATLTKNGKAVTKCTVCGKVSKTTTIYYPKTFSLSAATYTYDGKVKTPKVTIKDSKGKVLKKNTDYTLKSESGRKNPGEYTVTITFKGNYSGTKKINFTIKPKTVTGIKATQTTTSIKLTWSKVPGATGYRVYKYNTKTKKYEKVKDVKTNSLTINKLKAGTKYKYEVRAYTKDGSTIWGAYSKAFETATKPATPALKVKSTAKGKATLTWKDVSGESGYQVYYSTKKSSGFKKYSSPKANATKATVAKLTSGRTYYFRVRAVTKTASGTVYSDYKTVSVKVK